MNKEDRNYLLSKIDNEGFDYTFIDYSDFEDINDDKFHRLRNEYKQAKEKLAEYLGLE
jgi:hypothetical protein